MRWGLLFMLIGLIVGLLSGLADLLGLGQVRGFGWKQGLGVAVGLLLIGFGWYWGRKPKSSR
jgi:hypothetical protein